MSLHSRLPKGLCFQIKSADRNDPEAFWASWFKASLGPSVKTHQARGGLRRRERKLEEGGLGISNQPPILSGPWWRHLDGATLYLVL